VTELQRSSLSIPGSPGIERVSLVDIEIGDGAAAVSHLVDPQLRLTLALSRQ
jgi:hypothetical protein